MIEIAAKDGSIARVNPKDIQGMHGLLRLRPDLTSARGLSDEEFRAAHIDDGTRISFFPDAGIPSMDTSEPLDSLARRAGFAS
jgi:hypothetical protein